jgi:molybdopterin adenylyltransferase
MCSKTIRVLSVNISEKKGTVKKPADEILLVNTGVSGDAHAGGWNRQVSLLAKESVDKFAAQAGRLIQFGEFAENITTEGLLLYETHPLDRFSNENIILEVTQIGKKCHGDGCAIFREAGNCVMPKEGIFCRVIRGGNLKAGDTLNYSPRVFKTRIITLSDRASAGEYEDKSGPRTEELVNQFFINAGWQHETLREIIPDNPDLLHKLLLRFREEEADFIITTGGTGIGSRDITTEVVRPLLDKEIPGIMEMIRTKYGAEKPAALLSRSVAGILGKSIIFTLPGSVRAVEEYMAELVKSMGHMVYMLHGLDMH